VLETALNQEMTEHLGHDKHEPVTSKSGNARNGSRSKTMLTEALGKVQVEVSRTGRHVRAADRQEAAAAAERVDEMVLSLYARSLTTGEISAHLAESMTPRVPKQAISGDH
jgi:putative transposase